MTIRNLLAQFQAPISYQTIEFVVGNSGTFTYSAYLPFGGAVAGDYVLVVVASTAPGIQTPSGYTLLAAENYITAYQVHGAVFGRLLSSAENTVLLTQSGIASATVQVFRNVNAASPLDVAPTSDMQSSTPNSPSITTQTPNTRVVSLGAYYGESNSMTAPPEFYSDSNKSARVADSPRNILSCAASRNLSSAGIEDPGKWSGGFAISPSTNLSISFSIALRPKIAIQ